MASKQRWYQAWEWINHPEKGALRIFRQYNHMHGSWSPSEVSDVNPVWFASFADRGLDFTTLKCEPVTWWDREILQMFRTYGPKHFNRISIWEKDWQAVAREVGLNIQLQDPRSLWDKVVHWMLHHSQARRTSVIVRAFESFLQRVGW